MAFFLKGRRVSGWEIRHVPTTWARGVGWGLQVRWLVYNQVCWFWVGGQLLSCNDALFFFFCSRLRSEGGPLALFISLALYFAWSGLSGRSAAHRRLDWA